MKKLDTIKRYSGILLVIILSIIFYRLFDSIPQIIDAIKSWLSIFTPVFIGAILAYFLSPIAIAVENFLDTTKLSKQKRILSVLGTFFAFIAVIIITIVFISPSVANAIMEIGTTLQMYIFDFEANVKAYISDPTIQEYVLGLDVYLNEVLNKLASIELMTYIQSVFSAASTISTWFLGIVFCPYILAERDRLKTIFDNLALLVIKKEQLDFIHDYAYRSHRIFGNFVYGKFIDSVIIGVLAYFGFWVIGVPALPLMAMTIGITNMIPYFGPFIGAVPVIFFTLITGDLAAVVWVSLFILALQQFDGIILGPAILGETVGISPFWVIFAVTIFGAIWGFVGMFIGVPLIVIIRALYRDFIVYKKTDIEEEAS